jgi:putative transposase
MRTDQEPVPRDWRMPDEWWEGRQRRLPPRKLPPLGCHRPRVDDRHAMDAMFFVLRTGCQWHARHETGLCSRRSAHRRFQAWTAAGVFLAWWTNGLVADEALQGMDGAWLAMVGAMTTAPLGGEQGGQASDRAWEDRPTRRVFTDGGGVPSGLAVEGANRHAVKMARAPRASIPMARPEPTPASPQGMGLEPGEDVDEVRARRAACGCPAHLRAAGGRGQGAHAGRRVQGPTGGRRAHTQWDEPRPARADALGSARAPRSRVSAYSVCRHDLQASWPIGIGS